MTLPTEWQRNIVPLKSDPTADDFNTRLIAALKELPLYPAPNFDEAQLPNVDYQQAFSAFLLSHGMSHQQLDALIHALTTAPGL